MKGLVMSFICLGFILLYSSAGETADWIFMGKSRDSNVSGFIDKKDVKSVSGSIVRTSVKLEYIRGQTFKLRKTVSHAIGNEEIDCGARQAKTLQYTVYFTDGDSLSGSTTNWKFVIPKLILHNIYDYLCTNGRKL